MALVYGNIKPLKIEDFASQMLCTVMLMKCKVCGSTLNEPNHKWVKIEDSWVCGNSCKEIYSLNPLAYQGIQEYQREARHKRSALRGV